jgi:hypothetical protein
MGRRSWETVGLVWYSAIKNAGERPDMTTQCSSLSLREVTFKPWKLVWRCLAERDDVLARLSRYSAAPRIIRRKFAMVAAVSTQRGTEVQRSGHRERVGHPHVNCIEKNEISCRVLKWPTSLRTHTTQSAIADSCDDFPRRRPFCDRRSWRFRTTSCRKRNPPFLQRVRRAFRRGSH